MNARAIATHRRTAHGDSCTQVRRYEGRQGKGNGNGTGRGKGKCKGKGGGKGKGKGKCKGKGKGKGEVGGYSGTKVGRYEGT